MRRQTATVVGALVLGLLLFSGAALTEFGVLDHLNRVRERVGQDPFVVEVPGGTIRIPASDWKPMENSEAFAVNFEKATLEGEEFEVFPEAYPQVITVFKIPMSDPDRRGIPTGRPSEFAEFFVVHPGKVTFQLRVDRGQYWVLSRQTFEATTRMPPGVQEYQPFLSEEQHRLFLLTFDLEVKRTCFALQQLFSKSGN